MTLNSMPLSPALQAKANTAYQQLFTINDFIRLAVSWFNENQCFYGHGTDNAWDEATSLVLQGLYLPWNVDQRILNARLTDTERYKIAQLITKRAFLHIPVPYLIGQAWFCQWCFEINEHVLIPRSPLAEWINTAEQNWFSEQPLNRALDIGCGSGCIGLAIALSFANCQVDLVDIDQQALAIAKKNTAKYNLDQQVSVIQSDVFSTLVAANQYDLIISNPPYVPSASMDNLPAEYRHEPEHALEAGEDGLIIVDRLLNEANQFLADKGLLIVEVGEAAEFLIEKYPHLDFTWLEFEQGGDGVFLLTKEQLMAVQK